jgi:hypothetical protein
MILHDLPQSSSFVSWIGWGTMEAESIIFPLFFFEFKTVKEQTLSLCVDCTFKSTKKLNYDILGSLNKPTIPAIAHFPYPIHNL